MNKEKIQKVVHSSTNSHYIENVDSLVKEESFTPTKGAKAILTHTEHEAVETRVDEQHNIGFVNTLNLTDKTIRKVQD